MILINGGISIEGKRNWKSRPEGGGASSKSKGGRVWRRDVPQTTERGMEMIIGP